jgi:hypothetical protein
MFVRLSMTTDSLAHLASVSPSAIADLPTWDASPFGLTVSAMPFEMNHESTSPVLAI